MQRGIRFGRLFGIELAFDVSWLIIVLLMTWNLMSVFREWHSDWSSSLVIVVAVAATLLFFGSVLIHELAHSLVARAYDVPVNRITLFLFGGVSDIEREPSSPGAEFLMAVVGPLASVGLGIVFSLAMLGLIGPAAYADLRSAPSQRLVFAELGPLATLLAWLGPINIVVAVFNLIPGFPLDGGRILHSFLWKATGDRGRATRWATWAGIGFGWLLILSGVAMAFGTTIPFLGSGFAGGIWLVFIGWFLSSAARQSYARAVTDTLFADLPVSSLMRRTGAAVQPDLPVTALVHDWFMRTEERALPVMDGTEFLGLVCIANVRKIPEGAWARTRTGDIMTPVRELVVARPEENVAQALSKLARLDVGQLPVVRDGQLVGMLHQRDVMRWLEMHGDDNRPLRHSYAS